MSRHERKRVKLTDIMSPSRMRLLKTLVDGHVMLERWALVKECRLESIRICVVQTRLENLDHGGSAVVLGSQSMTNLVEKLVMAAFRLGIRDPNRNAYTQLAQSQTESIHAVPH
jgi:hypothetical protein